jgi:hypothetical protein
MQKSQITLPPPAEAMHAERPPIPISVPNSNIYPRPSPDITIQPRQGSLARPKNSYEEEDDHMHYGRSEKPKVAEVFDVKDIQGTF